jgi:hypothetical protein
VRREGGIEEYLIDHGLRYKIAKTSPLAATLKMVSFKEAFALSSHEVEAATPPGTVQIHREIFSRRVKKARLTVKRGAGRREPCGY